MAFQETEVFSKGDPTNQLYNHGDLSDAVKLAAAASKDETYAGGVETAAAKDANLSTEAGAASKASAGTSKSASAGSKHSGSKGAHGRKHEAAKGIHEQAHDAVMHAREAAAADAKAHARHAAKVSTCVFKRVFSYCTIYHAKQRQLLVTPMRHRLPRYFGRW